MAEPAPTFRSRQPPPPFGTVQVASVERLTPAMLRVHLEGEPLRGIEVTDPGASLRLCVPRPGHPLTLPEWQGNEFLLPDGSRPIIRTFTPPIRARGSDALAIDVVVHAGGAVSDWAQAAEPGATAGVSGPGSGFSLDEPPAAGYILAGDESALPAIAQLRATLSDPPAVVEVRSPEAAPYLESAEAVEWVIADASLPPGSALASRVIGMNLAPGIHLWAAGEAASMQRIRNHLFKDLGRPRGSATVRGYWKRDR